MGHATASPSWGNFTAYSVVLNMKKENDDPTLSVITGGKICAHACSSKVANVEMKSLTRLQVSKDSASYQKPPNGKDKGRSGGGGGGV